MALHASLITMGLTYLGETNAPNPTLASYAELGCTAPHMMALIQAHPHHHGREVKWCIYGAMAGSCISIIAKQMGEQTISA